MFAEMNGNKLVDSEEQVLAGKLYKDRQVKGEETVKCLPPIDYIPWMHTWNGS